VATEDLVWILEKMGVDTGIDMDRLIETGSFIEEHILKGQPVTSRVYNAMGAPKRTGNTFCR
jgi:hydroxymethylglutaryl-CoA lyase